MYDTTTEQDTLALLNERGRSAEIAQLLQRRILLGQIPIGSWLRHEALAEEFGTSRTPVREALHVLDDRGIVTIVRNRGARVNGHSSRDIRELGEVRAALEGFAAELAAERINDDQLERLLGAWRKFENSMESFIARPSAKRDAEAAAMWVAANEEFHNVIVEASGNRQLIESIANVHGRLPKNSSYFAYAHSSRLLRQNLKEHDDIAKAIARHDGTAARRLMIAHLRNSAEAITRWMEDHGLLRESSGSD